MATQPEWTSFSKPGDPPTPPAADNAPTRESMPAFNATEMRQRASFIQTVSSRSTLAATPFDAGVYEYAFGISTRGDPLTLHIEWVGQRPIGEVDVLADMVESAIRYGGATIHYGSARKVTLHDTERLIAASVGTEAWVTSGGAPRCHSWKIEWRTAKTSAWPSFEPFFLRNRAPDWYMRGRVPPTPNPVRFDKAELGDSAERLRKAFGVIGVGK